MIGMNAKPKLSIVDQRQATRHPVDYAADAEHRRLGEFKIQVRNVSAQGFMIEGDVGLDLGERIQVRLPTFGQIEAHLVWRHGGRLGFQFERIIRPADFAALLIALNPKPISDKRRYSRKQPLEPHCFKDRSWSATDKTIAEMCSAP